LQLVCLVPILLYFFTDSGIFVHTIFVHTVAQPLAPGTKAPMRASYFSLLACLMVASNGLAADSVPVALLNKLKTLAGAASRDCGSVPLQGDREPAIACAKDSHSAAKAYRVAFQLQATDSSMWQGAARDEHGKLWVAFYDSDSSGSPTLSTLPCRAILFVAQGGEVLDCQPIPSAP